MAASKELDDILNSALDDFEEDEPEVAAKGRESKASSRKAALEAAKKSKSADQRAKKSRADATIQNLTKLMGDMQSAEFSKTIEDTLTNLGKPGIDPQNPFKDIEHDPKVSEPDVDANIAKTLKMLSDSSKSGITGMEPATAEAMGEDIMKNIMADFEQMGEKEDFQQVVDGMMKQLLSKEIMYEPIKAICDKYPEWLAENEPKLKKEEYERFGKQYQYIQRIVAVYETQPDNFERLMELMQDMQECGQPPADIVKELAPGLEFGPDGMPVMPNMGPGFPQGPPVDMPPGFDAPQCSVM